MSTPGESTPAHWDAAYTAGDTTRGWYQSQATMSLHLIESTDLPATSSIVDVGSGASVLVDDLLAAGYSDITCMDHSPSACRSRAIAWEIARDVDWIVADLLTWQPPRTYDIWHDRAVLHFLLDEADIAAYRRTMPAGTHVGSWLVLGVFGPEGPQMCAGLPVRRYDDTGIDALLGGDFTRTERIVVDHVRPDGDTQQYLWTLARRDR